MFGHPEFDLFESNLYCASNAAAKVRPSAARDYHEHHRSGHDEPL